MRTFVSILFLLVCAPLFAQDQQPKEYTKFLGRRLQESDPRCIKPEIAKFWDHSKIVITGNGQEPKYAIYAFPPDEGKPSRFKYVLDGKYHLFFGMVGINDTDEFGEKHVPNSALTFRVMGDGQELWKTRPIQERGKLIPFKLDVTDVKELDLFVDCPAGHVYCNAVWFNPVVYSSGSPYDEGEAEKQLRKELQKAATKGDKSDLVIVCQRAIKLAKKAEDQSIASSAKRIALAAAKRTGDARYFNEVKAAIREIGSGKN